MKNDSRNKRKISRKAIVGILLIGIIVGGSSLGIALTQMGLPTVVENPMQINNINVTKYVENVMKGIPLDCYTYYPEGNKKLQPEIRVYETMTEKFYNMTKLDSRTLTTNAPYQAYLFSHCPFIDVSMQSLPAKFDPNLKSSVTLQVPLEIQKNVYESQQLTNYNFTEYAMTSDTIEQIGRMFAMTYPEVVDQLTLHKLFNKTSDCINPSWRSNSGLLDCTYHRSQFVVNTNSSGIIATTILPINGTGHSA